MWDEILAILQQKVKAGLQVRILYDDFGSMTSLPSNFSQHLVKLGIKAQAFNRVRPYIQTQVNNRDHRKIVIIDGHIGYVGGINLADEYINLTHPFGLWKDAAIRLNGQAVWSLTLLFLQMWNTKKQEDFDFSRYHFDPKYAVASDGLIQPFGDEPQGNEFVCENVYLNLINKAQEKVYLMSPYLVIDNELMVALTLAAKNGVDVRLIVPGIPDKWYVRFLAQAFYAVLIEHQVKVYEYTPGFIHSKTILADDHTGVVGTINLDYRSFYLHYECGVLMYKTQALKQLSIDFKQTFAQSHRLELNTVQEVHFSNRVLRSLLRLIAPLI
jgi:cardiolipin synthase